MRYVKIMLIFLVAVLIFSDNNRPVGEQKVRSAVIKQEGAYKKRLNVRFSPGTPLHIRKAFFVGLGLAPIAFDVFGFDVAEWDGKKKINLAMDFKKEFSRFLEAFPNIGAPRLSVDDYQVEDWQKRPVPQAGCLHNTPKTLPKKLIVPWYDKLLGVRAAHKFLEDRNFALHSQGIIIVDDGPILSHQDIYPALKRDNRHQMIFWARDKKSYKAGNHGTHVACLAAGYHDQNGIDGAAGPKAYILPLILNYVDEKFYFVSDIAIGLKYFKELEEKREIVFHVVNMSFGIWVEMKIFRAAIEQLNNKLFVVAAGNDPGDIDARPMYPASWAFPNVLAVAATDHLDNLSYFSTYGEKRVEIAAPGQGIISCVANNEYQNWQGTSMAAPLVAGTAVLLFSMEPSLTVAYAKAVLFAGADIKESLKGKIKGARRLNVLNSVKSLYFAPEPPR